MRRWRGERLAHEREDWYRLEGIVERVRRRGIRSLSADEVGDLGALYRKTAADLNYYRTHSTDRRFVAYLNALVGKAHNQIYRAGNLRAHDVTGFFSREFPRSVRRHASWTVLATALFAVAAVLGILEQRSNPEFYRLLVPEELVESLESGEPWYRQLSILQLQPMASSRIMTNNISVTFTVFALGITAGVGTALLLALNGVLIGTVGQLCAEYDQSLDFWAFVLPHGILELPAIFIAGGAGLLLGSALICGDRHRRRDMLRIKGREAVRLLVGTAPILVIAGLVEGFFSPMQYDPALKFGVAGLFGILLAAYLLWGGREEAKSP